MYSGYDEVKDKRTLQGDPGETAQSTAIPERVEDDDDIVCGELHEVALYCPERAIATTEYEEVEP